MTLAQATFELGEAWRDLECALESDNLALIAFAWDHWWKARVKFRALILEPAR